MGKSTIGIIIFLLSVSLTACSTVSTFNYEASGTTVGTKGITVGSVRYIPAESGKYYISEITNQPGHFLSSPIDDYVRSALKEELKNSGLLKEDSKYRIDSDVYLFGHTAEAFNPFSGGILHSLDIKIKLVGQHGIQTQRTYSLRRHAGWRTSPDTLERDINSMIAEAYDRFMREADVSRALSQA